MKKSLNTTFSSISEDAQIETSKTLVDSTPIFVISEIDEVNRDAVIYESLITLANPSFSASSEVLFNSDLHWSSK